MWYVAIEGNIGAGKTTLARLLAERLNARLVLENFADNPFLPFFYQNPERYAFPVEMFFLAERYQQLQRELAQGDLFHDWAVADFVFEKSAIFASITLNTHEFELFSRIFSILAPLAPRPTHYIWLQDSIPGLMFNILKRGRPYEKLIQESYLEQVEAQYHTWLRSLKDYRCKIIVNRSTADFEQFPELADTLAEWLKEGRSGYFNR